MDDAMATTTVTAEAPPACAHYARHCEVFAECCGQWVGCRLCHNERFEDHEIDRHAIRVMRCLSCRAEQPCARDCSSCGRRMGEYFCAVCNLFDDGGVDKKFFHCDDCGICRVGGRENYYHCQKCCGCYPHSLENKHKCLEGSMHRECPICLDVTFASLESVNVLPCGHVMHSSCFREYVRQLSIECPTCRTPIFSEDELRGQEDTDDGSDNNEEDSEGGTDGDSDGSEDEEDESSSEDGEEGDHGSNSDEDQDDGDGNERQHEHQQQDGANEQ